MKKVILFSSKPSSNHSISMIKSVKNLKDYELWANDVNFKNKYVSEIWNSSFLGIFSLILKLKKTKLINIQHEFNVWNWRGIISIPLLLILFKNKISLTLHTCISRKKLNSEFFKRFSLGKFHFFYKLYFIFFFTFCNLSKKIFVHSKDQKKILIKDYGFNKNKIFVNYIGINDNKNKIKKIEKKTYDIIMFGYFAPRKGIKEFLNICNQSKKKLRIVLAGGIQKKYKTYFNNVFKLSKKNKNEITIFKNISDEEIHKYHQRSKIAVFSHIDLLGTSAPLYHAIQNDNLIIAPKIGIFHESLLRDKFSYLYKNNNEFLEGINIMTQKKHNVNRNYLKSRLTWKKYTEKTFN